MWQSKLNTTCYSLCTFDSPKLDKIPTRFPLRQFSLGFLHCSVMIGSRCSDDCRLFHVTSIDVGYQGRTVCLASRFQNRKASITHFIITFFANYKQDLNNRPIQITVFFYHGLTIKIIVILEVVSKQDQKRAPKGLQKNKEKVAQNKGKSLEPKWRIKFEELL